MPRRQLVAVLVADLVSLILLFIDLPWRTVHVSRLSTIGVAGLLTDGLGFLGCIFPRPRLLGLLFVVALVSGTVLYAPFMRRIAFGTVRTERSARVKRLDQHNLIGIVALAWMAVIGLTGAINAFADPLTDSWRDGEVAAMAAAYEGEAPLPPSRYGSLDTAMASAQAQVSCSAVARSRSPM